MDGVKNPFVGYKWGTIVGMVSSGWVWSNKRDQVVVDLQGLWSSVNVPEAVLYGWGHISLVNVNLIFFVIYYLFCLIKGLAAI